MKLPAATIIPMPKEGLNSAVVAAVNRAVLPSSPYSAPYLPFFFTSLHGIMS